MPEVAHYFGSSKVQRTTKKYALGLIYSTLLYNVPTDIVSFSPAARLRQRPPNYPNQVFKSLVVNGHQLFRFAPTHAPPYPDTGGSRPR